MDPNVMALFRRGAPEANLLRDSQGLQLAESSEDESASAVEEIRSSTPLRDLQPILAGDLQHHKVLLHAGDLQNRGNRVFAGQDWRQAVQLYTDAIQLLLMSRGPCPSTVLPEMGMELAMAFLNRAEARLQLKHFEAAKLDAGKALKLQPHHVKSLFARGRAFHGLHQYKEAILFFKEALERTEGEFVSARDLTKALKASEVCNKQSRTWDYDLVCMWREVDKGKEPVCGEFIGPVKVGRAIDRALGRGLLVTRDVEPGDLLLVSKAVALATAEPSFSTPLLEEGMEDRDMQSYHEGLVQQVLDRAMSSSRFREQVYSLAADSKMGAACIKRRIPSMNMFSAEPEPTRCEEVRDEVPLNQENIDIAKIRGIIRTNAFKRAQDSHAGLWLLSSFINNSCTPNSCWTKIGKEAFCVRAARHLKIGQEVTISYLEAAVVPYAMRALSFQLHRGFQCRCPRCSFEKSLKHFTKPLNAKVAVQISNILAAAEVVEKLERALQNIVVFANEQQKQWLRTSYSLSFVLTLHDPSLQKRMGKLVSLETLLRAVQETSGVSEAILEMVREHIHDSECSSSLEVILASMYVCLYGKQPPATLSVLLALRDSMAKKVFDVKKAFETVVACSAADNRYEACRYLEAACELESHMYLDIDR